MSTVRSAPWWAGIALAVAVSLAAGYAADVIGVSLLGFAKSPISPIMMAIVIGMVVANTVSLPASLVTGLRFCASTVLRVGIMLLGIRLSLVSAGTSALLALPFVLVAIAVGLTTVGLLGRTMGLSRQLSGLIAVGTSICGVTAIVATAPIIEADQAEVSYSVACITVFGLAAMFFYPFLGHFLFANDPALAGLFLGTSIHETAQVAGAGMMYQAQYNAPQALDVATVTKLVRNLSMIAVIPLVGVLYGTRKGADAPGGRRLSSLVPWFIVGFALMSAARTVGEIGQRPFLFLDPAQWDAVVAFLQVTAERLLLVAMAAVGLTSMVAGIRKIGARPFALGLFAALVVGGVSLVLIGLFGGAVARGLAG
ncbi:MAG: putative sulfate exporter family transporter [Longimicrobiales bacterium]|nr:putative sulfate exporter family transporter [Longimicrobiales bacterium]